MKGVVGGQDGIHEAEAIVGKRVWGGNQSTGPRTYYTVRWKAGDVTEEYEESGNLDGCGEMIAEYNAGLAIK